MPQTDNSFLSNFLNISRLVQYNIKFLILATNNIALEVIKVNVTPRTRTAINEPHFSVLTNQVLHVPALTKHCLKAVTNLGPDNLRNKKRNILLGRNRNKPYYKLRKSQFGRFINSIKTEGESATVEVLFF